TSTASSTPWTSFTRPRTARPSSFWTATSATAHRISRIPPRRTASRWARRRCASPNATMAGLRTPSSWSPTRAHFAAGIGARGAQTRGRWTEMFAAYRSKYPQLATEIDLMQRRELPAGWDRGLPVFPADPKGIAGRDASAKVLNVLAQNIPWLLGGSADLA